MTVPPQSLTSVLPQGSSLHEAQWAAWLAKGLAHDVQVRKRTLKLLLALGSVALIGSAILLAR